MTSVMEGLNEVRDTSQRGHLSRLLGHQGVLAELVHGDCG